MEFDKLNEAQIRDYLNNTASDVLPLSEINDLERILTIRQYKASPEDENARTYQNELLSLLVEIASKRKEIISIISSQIISEAKARSEKLFIREQNKVDAQLDPRIRDIEIYIHSLIGTLSDVYLDSSTWDVNDEVVLKTRLDYALQKDEIRGYMGSISGNSITDKLTYILSEQFLRVKLVHYLKTYLAEYSESLNIPKHKRNNQNIEHNEHIADSNNPKIVAWHYAIALAILQQAGILPHTIGKRDSTIQQVKNYFKVSDKLSRNVYDSMKKMKYPGSEQDWNINYALETEYTPKRKNYKRIVISLLGNDTNAISLVDNLID